jgi:hypothetical protein
MEHSEGMFKGLWEQDKEEEDGEYTTKATGQIHSLQPHTDVDWAIRRPTSSYSSHASYLLLRPQRRVLRRL